MTVNVPSLPLTVPRLVRPSPQLMVAMKRPAVVAAFASVKVATGPVNDLPLVRVRIRAWPARLSG